MMDEWLRKYIESSFGEVVESITRDDTWHVIIGCGPIGFDDLVSLDEECQYRGYALKGVGQSEEGLYITIVRCDNEQCI